MLGSCCCCCCCCIICCICIICCACPGSVTPPTPPMPPPMPPLKPCCCGLPIILPMLLGPACISVLKPLGCAPINWLGLFITKCLPLLLSSVFYLLFQTAQDERSFCSQQRDKFPLERDSQRNKKHFQRVFRLRLRLRLSAVSQESGVALLSSSLKLKSMKSMKINRFKIEFSLLSLLSSSSSLLFSLFFFFSFFLDF